MSKKTSMPSARDLKVVSGVRLAEGRGLIGRINFKILRREARPADAVLGGDVGEDGICRKRDAIAACFEPAHRLRRGRGKAADCSCAVELVGVEVLEQRLVVARFVRAVNFGKLCPEGLLIRARAVVADHGGSAGPDGVDKRFRLVAVRRKLFGKEPEIARGKGLLVHRQQRPVQVK